MGGGQVSCACLEMGQMNDGVPGAYVKKVTVSSTMGPGVSVDRASVDA